MTIRSELKKIIDVSTYEETKNDDGSLDVFVINTENTGLALTFDATTVENSKQREIAELIAAHFGTNK